MGLGESDPPAAEKRSASAEIYCSICLDAVSPGGDRSTARLQCGHEFHLDCIGSAFNAKGVMQCPNCREIGKGNWLYANGSRSLPDRSFDEWTHDEDLYDFNYTQMPFGVHWCPFSRLARVLRSFEEGEISPAIAFQDVVGYHVMFTGNPATSSVSNRCPYSTYMPSLQPSSSSNPPVSAESHNDGLAVRQPSSRTSRQTHVRSPHVLPAVDLHYHNWEHHSPLHSQPSSRSSGSIQDTNTSARVQAVRLDLDGLPSAGSPIHHFVLGHGSSSRSTGTFMSTVAPPYFNSQPHPHVSDNPPNAHNPLSIHRTTFSGPQRSGVRGLPTTSHHTPLDLTNYYLFPSTASSSRSSQESESRRSDHFYSRGRDRFAPLPLLPVDRDTRWWMPLPQSAGLPDSRSMRGFWHRNGSERPSTRGIREGPSYRPSPVSRMRPYN